MRYPLWRIPVSGFKPLYPEARFIYTVGSGNMRAWPEVESLQPTLQWESVPGRVEDSWFNKEPFIAADPERIRNVTYDVKVWRVKDLSPEKLVYERKRIKGTEHRLEEPLEPDSKYYWSVRARFEFDGKPRVSEWSMLIIIDRRSWCVRKDYRKRGQIPPLCYYTFKTP